MLNPRRSSITQRVSSAAMVYHLFSSVTMVLNSHPDDIDNSPNIGISTTRPPALSTLKAMAWWSAQYKPSSRPLGNAEKTIQTHTWLYLHFEHQLTAQNHLQLSHYSTGIQEHLYQRLILQQPISVKIIHTNIASI